MYDAKERALALGYFDGLHVAHMKVLAAALTQKKCGLVPAVLLFDRHPAEVLYGAKISRLLTEADRDAILSDMGFELIRMSFAGIKDLSPASFFFDILVKKLRCGFVSCGYNYTFGKNGEGSENLLAALCLTGGVALSVSEQVCDNGIPVSSSAIRNAAAEGDMETVSRMLGRPLTFEAPVFSGDHRGRKLDAPTANQYLPDGFIRPRAGVYTSVAQFEGKRYPAVTNIGVRPTFHGDSFRSETHIMDYSGDLYGKQIRLYLLSFLRAERTFDSFDALKTQIGADIAAAKSRVCASGFLSEKIENVFK